jgi:hypothetical protein
VEGISTVHHYVAQMIARQAVIHRDHGEIGTKKGNGDKESDFSH